MFRILFVFFVIVPIVEIAVLMHVGEWLGAWPTIAIVIITAWLGAKNVRQQGIATLQSVQTKMAQGDMPSNEIFSGVMLLVAGVLLLTPGFVTDIFGLSLLIPQVRTSLMNVVKQHVVLNKMSSSSPFNHQSMNAEHGSFENSEHHSIFSDETPKSSAHQGKTLEGEFERKE